MPLRRALILINLVAFASTICLAQARPTPGNAPATSPGSWSQLSQLSPGKGSFFSNPDFGSVAISGDTVVLRGVGGQSGIIAEVYVKTSKGWGTQPTAYLSGPPVSENPVAIDGDTIVVGPYVYVKPAGGWTDMTPTATLSATSSDDAFAAGVAVSGNTIAITDAMLNNYSGVLYVYSKPARGWTNMTQTAALTASDEAQGIEFAYSVSVSGPTVAVSASHFHVTTPGKSYVFVEPASGWTNMTETAQLTAFGSKSPGGNISIDGNVVVVGDSESGRTPAAYVFAEPSSGWQNMRPTAILSSSGSDSSSLFGSSVSISGKIVAVGAPQYSPSRVMASSGGIYIFEEPATGWHDLYSNTVLTGSDARYNAFVGFSVANSGSAVVASGDFFNFNSVQSTPVYIFGQP